MGGFYFIYFIFIYLHLHLGLAVLSSTWAAGSRPGFLVRC